MLRLLLSMILVSPHVLWAVNTVPDLRVGEIPSMVHAKEVAVLQAIIEGREPQEPDSVSDPTPGAASTDTPTPGVEEWRDLVEYFWVEYGGDRYRPEHVDWALRIMACESGGDPNAQHPGSHASGLYQHLPIYWAERSAAAGWAGADIFDPVANVAVAAWLLYTNGGGPSHWECKAEWPGW